MASTDYSWALPFMRAGYAGRGITYLAIAGLSLWAIWRGGQAQGTSSALEILGSSTWGIVVLLLIFVGLIAYAIWRGIDAVEDLEEYGTEAKGLIARAGMIVTGLIHGAIGALALSIVFGRSGSGSGADSGGGAGGSGGSGIDRITQTVLEMPGGQWIVGIAALCTIGAGLYYLKKAWDSSYRQHLRANRFTRNWDWALKAGVASNAVLIVIIGGFLMAAAITGSGNEAGGVGQAFQWLREQAFGNILVVIVCIGLLFFAFFCFVNARYRIVPRATDEDVSTLAADLKAKARAVAA